MTQHTNMSDLFRSYFCINDFELSLSSVSFTLINNTLIKNIFANGTPVPQTHPLSLHKSLLFLPPFFLWLLWFWYGCLCCGLLLIRGLRVTRHLHCPVSAELQQDSICTPQTSSRTRFAPGQLVHAHGYTTRCHCPAAEGSSGNKDTSKSLSSLASASIWGRLHVPCCGHTVACPQVESASWQLRPGLQNSRSFPTYTSQPLPRILLNFLKPVFQYLGQISYLIGSSSDSHAEKWVLYGNPPPHDAQWGSGS